MRASHTCASTLPVALTWGLQLGRTSEANQRRREYMVLPTALFADGGFLFVATARTNWGERKGGGKVKYEKSNNRGGGADADDDYDYDDEIT